MERGPWRATGLSPGSRSGHRPAFRAKGRARGSGKGLEKGEKGPTRPYQKQRGPGSLLSRSFLRNQGRERPACPLAQCWGWSSVAGQGGGQGRAGPRRWQHRTFTSAKRCPPAPGSAQRPARARAPAPTAQPRRGGDRHPERRPARPGPAAATCWPAAPRGGAGPSPVQEQAAGPGRVGPGLSPGAVGGQAPASLSAGRSRPRPERCPGGGAAPAEVRRARSHLPAGPGPVRPRGPGSKEAARPHPRARGRARAAPLSALLCRRLVAAAHAAPRLRPRLHRPRER